MKYFKLFKKRSKLFSSSFLLLSCFFTAPIFAQNYYFLDAEVDTIFEINEIDNFAKIKLPFVNNLTTASYFQWIKTETILPENWQVSVCDETTCYNPEIEDAISYINGNSNYEFALQIYPFNNFIAEAGIAEINLEVAAIATDIKNIKVTFEVVEYLNNNFIVKKEVKIYPNPSNNFMHLGEIENFNFAKIFSLQGVQILKSNSKNVDVSELKSGNYIVKIYNFEEKIIAIKKFTKI